MVRQDQTFNTHVSVFYVCSGKRFIYIYIHTHKVNPLSDELINNVFLFYFTEPPPNLNARGTRRGSGKYLLMALSVTCLFYHTHCLRMEPQNWLRDLQVFLLHLKFIPIQLTQEGEFLIPLPPRNINITNSGQTFHWLLMRVGLNLKIFNNWFIENKIGSFWSKSLPPIFFLADFSFPLVYVCTSSDCV